MSCLVHPTGWRLYFSKYWRSNFFINKKSYILAFYKTRFLFEIILGILNRYFLKTWKYNALTFSTFKIFLSHNTVFILVHYKFYWRNIFKSSRFFNFEKFALKSGYEYEEERRWFPLNKLIQQKSISFLEKPYGIFSFINTNAGAPQLNAPLKHLTYFFFLLPHFIFLKNIFSMIVQRIFPSSPRAKTFFFGMNRKNFNANDVSNVAESLLRAKNRPTYVFYRLIRILNYYKRRQKLKGFKVLLAGRFSRRDRATFLWRTFDQVRTGSRIANVSFYSRPIILNYSKCAVKLWVCRG